MSVGIKVGSITDEVGTSDFLYAFFSTISGNLEPDGWGTKYPILINKLYQGTLTSLEAEKAIVELNIIKKDLSNIPPSKVIWDIENKSKKPPWGNKTSKEITSLANYFVTSTGRDFILTLQEALEDATENSKSVDIVQC